MCILLFYRAYQVATQDDLWEHLTKTAQDSLTFDNLTNVKDIMNGWTTKMGFPVVNVSRNYTTNEIEFSQSRFTFTASTTSDALWWIPLSYTTMNEANFDSTKPKSWIRGTPKIIKEFENITDDEWIIANIQGTGELKKKMIFCKTETILFFLIIVDKFK